jgi:hypothetical protein
LIVTILICLLKVASDQLGLPVEPTYGSVA